MTINQAYLFVQFIFNKKSSGFIKPDDFNTIAPIAQMSVLNDRLGNIKKYQPGAPVPPYGFNINQKIREDLRLVMVKPTTTAVSSGVAAYPADYLYCDTITAGGKLIPEATRDEITWLNNSVIIPPTANYPKYVLQSDGIYVFPTTITSIDLAYVKKPSDPFWPYTIVNGEPVYNAGGSPVNFTLGEGAHLEICANILSYIGINLSMGEITQYAEMMAAQGK